MFLSQGLSGTRKTNPNLDGSFLLLKLLIGPSLEKNMEGHLQVPTTPTLYFEWVFKLILFWFSEILFWLLPSFIFKLAGLGTLGDSFSLAHGGLLSPNIQYSCERTMEND